MSLNPAFIVDAFVTQLALIPDLATAMTVFDASQNPTIRITAFHYRLGEDFDLAQAIYKMPQPSMLVAWSGTVGGNFNGMQVWKHKVDAYIRMANTAVITPVTTTPHQTGYGGYEDLWWMICNQPPQNTIGNNPNNQNVRYMNILPDLDIMDTPSIMPFGIEPGIDMFKAIFVFNEIGDI